MFFHVREVVFFAPARVCVESSKRGKWELDSRNLFMKNFGSFNGSVINPNADVIDVSSLPTTFKRVRLHDFKMQPAFSSG